MNVLRPVAFKNDCPEFLETVGNGRFSKVGTGNLIAEVEQYLGDTAHADTADAYEMDALDFGEQSSSQS